MSSMFYRTENATGVREINRGSTWHNEETAVAMKTASDMLCAAQSANAWPLEINKVPLFSADGIEMRGTYGVRARYLSAPDQLLSSVGSVWTDLLAQWEETLGAAIDMGARPLMAYALVDNFGRPNRLLATFDLPDASGIEGSTIKPYLLGICGLDGKTVDRWIDTTIDTVCANTLALALSEDRAERKASGLKSSTVRHTGKGVQQYAVLRDGITRALEAGKSVALAHAEARDTILRGEASSAAFDALFPRAEENDRTTDNMRTRARNRRDEAFAALRMPINRRDLPDGSLQKLWNTATFLVDRGVDGAARSVRGGGDAIASMISGTRGQRVQEIQEIIYRVLNRDGSETEMTASEAVDAGAVSGADLLSSMLDA